MIILLISKHSFVWFWDDDNHKYTYRERERERDRERERERERERDVTCVNNKTFMWIRPTQWLVRITCTLSDRTVCYLSEDDDG
jgi:hypothetical protein